MTIKSQDYQLLLDACKKTVSDQLSNQQEDLISSEQNASEICDEIDAFLGEIFSFREKNHEVAIESMQPMLLAFDLSLLQVCDLAYFAWKHQGSRVKLIWPNRDLPERPTSTRVLYLLTSNLAQSLQATRVLLLKGFEGQSRAMFRSFVELADLSLAVIADENIYRQYITVFEDEEEQLKHWRKYLSPGIIRQRLAQLDSELEIEKITSIPADEVRRDTYKWFSLFSHNNMVAHLASAYPQRLNEETCGAIAMLGDVGEMTRSTFSRIVLYLWLFFLNFDRLLQEKHQWKNFQGTLWRGRYFYRSQVFDTFFRENYNQL
jgi:hypothetical protein